MIVLNIRVLQFKYLGLEAVKLGCSEGKSELNVKKIIIIIKRNTENSF